MNKKRTLVLSLNYVILSIMAIASIFPFLWMLSASTNKSVDVTRGRILPGGYFMENLKAVLGSDLNYLTAFKNSLIIAIAVGVTLSLLSVSLPKFMTQSLDLLSRISAGLALLFIGAALANIKPQNQHDWSNMSAGGDGQINARTFNGRVLYYALATI